MKYKLQYKCVKFTKRGNQMKWCQSSFVMEVFSLQKSPKKGWFNTTSHGYHKYNFFYLCQYCTANKKSKNKDGLTLLHMAAVCGHFRNFQ